ncbi:MAG: SpoIIE family protein phosphatase [Gammaproteobacteria bacterium]|nr:SpoIIE family protein phosphatase [Pseudomonadales bacterium]MCP5348819.1 SpoIIE family protein phosphatase [Pseudomonadales bacterium]
MTALRQPYISLATRISLSIVLLGTLVFIAILGTNYFLSRNLLEDYVASLAVSTADSTANEIESIFKGVAGNADSLADIVSRTNSKPEQVHQTIQSFLIANDDIFGMTVGLEPGVLFPESGEFSPYYFRGDQGLGYADLANPEYAYQSWDWYTVPRARQDAVWSEPYFDEGGGNILMITYSKPIWSVPEREFAGIATADIALDWLQEIVNGIQIGKTGFGMIISSRETIVGHPDATNNMKSLQSLVDTEPLAVIRNNINANSSVNARYLNMPCWHTRGDCWTAIESLTSIPGWNVLIVVPEDELVSEISTLTGKIAVLALLGLAAFVIIILTVTHRFTRPLSRLATATRDIGAGKLENVLPAPERHDEIGRLTNDFQAMRDSLRDYIAQLQETTAKHQKLESEMKIASEIQMSMVPGGGTINIKRDTFQLYALLQPALSVGGDLYYVVQDGNVLYFIIGDVSGKGVPAALFMAKTTTLFTGELQNFESPGAALSNMNNALVQENNACVFVSALCGTLDIASGELRIANAGHMDPISRVSGNCSEMPVDGGPVLGVLEDAEYPTVIRKLSKGTTLIFYTDGISEAFNERHEQYGTRRLLQFASQNSKDDTECFTLDIREDIRRFVGDAAQSDDLTLMLIKYGE